MNGAGWSPMQREADVSARANCGVRPPAGAGDSSPARPGLEPWELEAEAAVERINDARVKFYRARYDLLEKLLGPEHPTTVASLLQLSTAYRGAW